MSHRLGAVLSTAIIVAGGASLAVYGPWWTLAFLAFGAFSYYVGVAAGASYEAAKTIRAYRASLPPACEECGTREDGRTRLSPWCSDCAPLKHPVERPR